ncbi:MAG: hypothetical protein GXC76_12075 [Rhodanobacteraceae bacterium]|jgi:DNA-binding winged helix-turn-helix (wHTH) protein|nr:hypothetical protein [Rhodanobacteraceae bacterium]
MGAGVHQQAESIRYCFADVAIEPHGRRVVVGARERAASRRAFDLLLALCEAPGRVLSRDELSNRLWPGGQIVSDEALTQVIFRARAVLGAQGERIVTVRGVGIRLDADVQRIACEAPAPTGAEPRDAAASAVKSPAEPPSIVPASPSVPAADPADPPTPPALPARRRIRVDVVLALLVVALLALALYHWPVGGDAWVDRGYGLRTGDVHATHADSARLLGEALRHDNGGDRARARALLEALADSDAQTPWPPLLLGLWAAGAGDLDAAERWLAQARERAARLHDTYVNAVLRYANAERDGTVNDIVRYAGAVLDLRPDAWRMHLARAHLMRYQGQREAALAEIRQIRVDELGNRKLEAALADRASFGDVAGAQAALDGLSRATDAAAWEYLAGRIAWSRGDRGAARAAWQRAAAEAHRNGRSDIGNRARASAGLAAMLDGDRAAAIAHFERARVGMAEAGWLIDEIDLSLLLAQLHALDGSQERARAEFDHARELVARSGEGVLTTQTQLVGARLFPHEDIAPSSDPSAAAQALLAAWRAYNRGDEAAARADLTTAEQRGILESNFVDEANLLAGKLGMPVAAERSLDPPYPPLAGAAARLFLAGGATPEVAAKDRSKALNQK